MVNTDYSIEALDILLDKKCLAERYFPLIPYKDRLISELQRLGCRTKSDAEKLGDGIYQQIGLETAEIIQLFRRFLTIYDPKPQKFREIEKPGSDPAEQAAFRELYCLPGVKQIRASLYCRAGYKSLRDIAEADAEEILEKTALTISENNMSCIVPLPKEVRTHIAVAKAFTRE